MIAARGRRQSEWQLLTYAIHNAFQTDRAKVRDPFAPQQRVKAPKPLGRKASLDLMAAALLK